MPSLEHLRAVAAPRFWHFWGAGGPLAGLHLFPEVKPMVVAIWAQTAVLTVTAYFILRYTCEAKRLRKTTEQYTNETAALRRETVRQNRLQLRPIPLPEFDNSGPKPSLRLRNCGNGCAVNLDLSLVAASDAPRVQFEPITYLPAGAAIEVEFYRSGNRGRGPGLNLESIFFPQFASSSDHTLVINFEDVERRRYGLRATVQCEADQAKLPRRVHLGPVEDYEELAATSQASDAERAK